MSRVVGSDLWDVVDEGMIVRATGVVVGALERVNRQATKYLHPKFRVKATRPYKPTKFCEMVVLTMGRPNFAERQFVKACVEAGEPFPIRKVQVKEFPSRNGK